MKGLGLLVCLAPVAAFGQTDHDNIDAGRPLRFEDAEPVAHRTLAFEYGLGVSALRRLTPGLDGTFELVWGSNLNGQFEIGFSPLLGGRADSGDTYGAIGEYHLAYLYSFRQEIGNTPALALKAEAAIPGVSGQLGVYRLRGIATKSVGPYGRVHLNLDVDVAPAARGGDRALRLGGVIGFTNPIGYPREFNTTGLAEIAVVPGDSVGVGTTVSLGVGIRRQISPRAVLDLGAQLDLFPGRNAPSTPLRLIAGYSTSF